jgi:parallel beta-helix repeat protein
MEIAYTSHDPVLISSNSDFVAAGFLGYGNESHPYTLDGVSIFNDNYYCFYIRNTDAHFIFSNSLIDTGGVYLFNVTNGRIDSCVIFREPDSTVSDQGAYFGLSENCSIKNCTVFAFTEGIRIAESKFLTFANNTVHDNWDTAYWISWSDNVTLANNTISNNKQGVSLFWNENFTLLENTFENCGVSLVGGSYAEVHITSSGNIVNGKPLGYFWNLNHEQIDGSMFGQVILAGCNNVTVHHGTFHNSTVGITVLYSHYSKLYHNTITVCVYGIRIRMSLDCTIFNNTIGISETGMETHYSMGTVIANNSFNANIEYGLRCYDSSHSIVENNTLTDNGVFLHGYSEDDWEYSFADNTVNGKRLGYFWNQNDAIIDGTLYGQVILANCTGMTVRNGVFNNATVGINIGYSSCVIDQCELAWNSMFGAKVSKSSSCVLKNSVFHGSQISPLSHGIYMDQSSDCMFVNNSIFNNEIGLYASSAQNTTITNCTIYNNTNGGIRLLSLADSFIINNTLYGNGERGVYFYSSSVNCTVIRNTITDNLNWGIRVDGPNNTIYDNIIGWNSEGNAYDSGTGNQWDNGIDTGNGWGDSDGSGEYLISGTSGSVDHYPRRAETTPPTVDEPGDIVYDQGDTNNNITWSPYDEHPSSYLVLRNETLHELGSWDGGVIVVNIDGLSMGYYNFTLVANDTCGNSGIDTVWVLVNPPGLELTPPDVFGTSPVVIEFATFGNQIEWTMGDRNPNQYRVTGNSTTQDWSPWTNGTYTYDVDLLPVGEHNFTVVVTDYFDNQATHTIIVIVQDTLGPTWDETPTNQVIDYGVPLAYKVNASDPSGVVYFWINNTFYFNIDSSGLITNTTILNLRDYGLWFFAEDMYGNAVHSIIKISVVDNSPPLIEGPGPLQIEVDAVGSEVSWNVFDTTPSTYTILLNETPVDTGGWSGGWYVIGYSTDDLDLGAHNITLLVIDLGGRISHDTVIVVVVDTTDPTVDHPPDRPMELGTTGFSIEWTPYDFLPESYIVLQNGEEVSSGDWDGSPISIGLDGLSLSVHSFTLTVYDTSQNFVSDEVIITVVDTTSPNVNSPTDMIVEMGSEGNVLSWIPFDHDPATFVVFMNGSEIQQGTWNSSVGISVEVDQLILGIYNFSIVVWDGSGHSDADIVFVQVVDTTAPTIDHPTDVQYEFGLAGNSIVWHPSDVNPLSYEIFRDGLSIAVFGWDGSEVSISVDDLNPGVYNYTIIVQDTSGNTMADTVMVHVMGDVPIPVQLILQVVSASIAGIGGTIGAIRWFKGRGKKDVQPKSMKSEG